MNQATDFNGFFNPLLSTLTPYVAGEQPKMDNLTKLNTNENPYPPSPKVVEAVKQALGETGEKLRCYPDPDSRELCQVIADYYQVDVAQVFVGNGSDEVLGHIFKTFFDPNRRLATPSLGYSFYPVYAKLFELMLEFVPLNADFSINPDGYRFDDKVGGIILANPNAPTGQALGLAQIEQILQQNPSIPVVIDEAYVDFGGESAIGLVDKYPNLVVCQTTSKSRALAGMRVGYAIAQAPMIAALNTVKNCFNSYPIDRLAQVAAIASFGDEAYFQEKRQAVMDNRTWLVGELTALGFEVVPSLTNFVFVSHKHIKARDIQSKLREKGVIVRHFGKPAEIENFLRISVGTEQENARLIEVLQGICR